MFRLFREYELMTDLKYLSISYNSFLRVHNCNFVSVRHYILRTKSIWSQTTRCARRLSSCFVIWSASYPEKAEDSRILSQPPKERLPASITSELISYGSCGAPHEQKSIYEAGNTLRGSTIVHLEGCPELPCYFINICLFAYCTLHYPAYVCRIYKKINIEVYVEKLNFPFIWICYNACFKCNK